MTSEELEKFEKDLGISVDILLKALTKGIWVKKGDDISHKIRGISVSATGSGRTNTVFCLSYRECEGGYRYIVDNYYYYENLQFEDYGKTWALTKKELLKK